MTRWIFPLWIAGVVLVMGWDGYSEVKRDQLRASQWEQWEASVAARGCKVTSFVGTRRDITPVWTCPDGSALLGRAR